MANRVAKLLARCRSTETGCLEWQGSLNGSGYAKGTIAKRTRILSRYVWESERGPIPPGIFVCHTCDNRRCLNIEHLWLGTRQENARDMVSKGRQNDVQGEANGRSRLSACDVDVIRNVYAARASTMSQLAKVFQVNVTTISRAVRAKTWGETHVA